jgi:hypothetical protein
VLFHCKPVNQQKTTIFALILWDEQTKPFLKRKKVSKVYFHFRQQKKCPPFLLLTHTWWCENITASPCVFSTPFLDKVRSHFFLLMIICNSLLLLKSLPINVINCIQLYVNCSALIGACNWQSKYLFVYLYANHLPWYIAVIVVFSKTRDKCLEKS